MLTAGVEGFFVGGGILRGFCGRKEVGEGAKEDVERR